MRTSCLPHTQLLKMEKMADYSLSLYFSLSLSFFRACLLLADRLWLTDMQQVQKLQEKVYLALQHSLNRSGASEEKLTKVALGFLFSLSFSSLRNICRMSVKIIITQLDAVMQQLI